MAVEHAAGGVGGSSLSQEAMAMKFSTFIVGTALVTVAASGTRAWAGDDEEEEFQPLPVPQPILSPEGARREGPVARQWVDLAATYSHLGAAMPDDIADAFSLQFAAGPRPVEGGVRYVVGDVFGWLEKYSLRARWTHVRMHDGTTRGGPLTIALQRFFEPNTLNIATLVHLHVGLEATFATPWFDDRKAMAPVAFQKLYAVETELAHNGYSIQPAGAYLRADLLLCRNIFLEAGLSPEVFVPTENEQSREYGLRWHVAAGFNLACGADPESRLRPLGISFEVRGRGRLDSLDGSPHHNALNSIMLQYHLGSRFVINAFASRATGVSLDQYFVAGVRLQLGIFERQGQ